MAFTEFYCQTTASNLNAGSTTADSAVYTGVGDSDGTSIFTPSDGSTPASTVSVGHFGSVYVTSGATVAVFIGRITAVAAGVNGAVTFSTTAKSGTFPASSGSAHTITLKTGGAWKGPNAAVVFPFATITGACTDANADCVRVNFKSGTNYAITAALTASGNNVVFQGYTSSAGDGGRATIDGGTSGASYILLTVSGTNNVVRDFIFQNNGATGNQIGVSISGASNFTERVVINSVRGSGLQLGASGCEARECEAYSCNQNNSASVGGFAGSTNGVVFAYCIGHDNTGNANSGFVALNSVTFIGCIADTNGLHGFNATSQSSILQGCVAYNNTSDGFRVANGASVRALAENCLFISNGVYGVNTPAATQQARLINCGYFGNGTAAISTTAGQNIYETGAITLASSPFVDAANGDFRINLAAAKGAGRGTFLQTAASYAGTIGYPDLGAAQHLEAAIPTIAATYA